MMRQSSLPIFVVAMLVASNAWAHPGHFASATFASGFAHPWLGLDHSLAAAAGAWRGFLAGLATGTRLLPGVGIAGGHVIRRHVPRLWPAFAIACSVVGAWLLATT